MKQGDRVVCIKDFNKNEYHFIKDKIYVIRYIHLEKIVAVAPVDYSGLVNEIVGRTLVDQVYVSRHTEHFWFSIEYVDPEEDINESSSLMLNEYFIDLKENRKRKLKKLYGHSEKN